MDGIFDNDENTQGQLKEAGAVQGFEIREESWKLQNWVAWHANAPHSRVPTDDEENLSIAKFLSGVGLLDSDNILRGGQQMVKKKHVPNEDL
jgi:hypothetical protein